jgi:hypothetical protein
LVPSRNGVGLKDKNVNKTTTQIIRGDILQMNDSIEYKKTIPSQLMNGESLEFTISDKN